MHHRVNILQYVKKPSGRWQWAPIPRNRRTGAYVWAKAESTHFYIVWREQSRRRYEKAGSTPAEALEAKRRKEFELLGRAAAGETGRRANPREPGITAEAAVADYLDYVRKRKRPGTHKRYRVVMNHFLVYFGVARSLSSIAAAEIDDYRDERLSHLNPWGGKITPRNVNSEVAMIRAFYYYLQKFRDPGLKNPAARIKPLAVAKRLVDTYEEEELDRLFAACSPEELAMFKAFFYTGLREQELANLHWPDVNLSKGLLFVRAKPEQGFIPKDWEERTIPLHPELITLLKALPRRHRQIVFPSFGGHSNGHLLRTLKNVAERAQLPGRWYLHKFRKTFATRALEKGADIATVQALLGHKNMTTTAHYLSTSAGKMRDAVGRL
jgi:integrase